MATRNGAGSHVPIAALDKSLDGIHRRDGAVRVLLTHSERSCQHTQLTEFGLRPLDAPARREAQIRELRDVSLQTDR